MKFIKKHKNKLFILMLTLISALTLFLNVGKTYAYETNQFSYTVSNVSTINNNVSYDDTNKTLFKNININANQADLIFTLNNTLTLNDCYILINFIPLESDDNINYSIVTSQYSRTLQILPRNINDGNITNTNSVVYLFNEKTQITKNNITFYTLCTKLNFQDSSINTNPQYNIIKSFYMQFNTLCTTAKYNKIQLLNIDFVDEAHLSLSQYYENYYGGIANNYEQLQSDYNDLQDEYTTLEGNYNTLEENYNQLQSDYNDLQESYDNLGNVYSSLWNNIPYYALVNDIYDYSYSSSFSTFVQHYNADVYNIDEMQQDNIINGSTLNFANLTNLNIYNDIYNLGIYFNSSYNSNEWRYLLPTEEINISCNVPIGLNNNNKIVLTFKRLLNTMRVYDLSITYNDLASNNFMINKELINKIDSTFNYETFNYLDSIHIVYDKATLQNSTFKLNSISSNYYQGYTIGFEEGFNSGRTTQENLDNESINALENNINTLNEQIEIARQDIIRQQQLIQALNEQIGSISDDYNLNNLMWTIASTPFESFKQIWNVNFLGVNITQMVTGLLTAFIVLYIVKKFFL